MQEGTPTDAGDSVEPGSTSTCMPGHHRWMMIVVTHGDVFGADSLGHPVFVPSPTCEPQVAFGCADCDEPWTESLSEQLS